MGIQLPLAQWIFRFIFPHRVICITHPDVTRGSKNDVSTVPQIQGKAKSGKEKAKPILPETTGAKQKVWHEKPIFKAHGIIDTDLARDNLENDIPFADLQDL